MFRPRLLVMHSLPSAFLLVSMNSLLRVLLTSLSLLLSLSPFTHRVEAVGLRAKDRQIRQFQTHSTFDSTLLHYWNSSNSRLNSLDGDVTNHVNETALISLAKASDGYVVFIKLSKSCSIYHPPNEWFDKNVVGLLRDVGIGPDEIIALEAPGGNCKCNGQDENSIAAPDA